MPKILEPVTIPKPVIEKGVSSDSDLAPAYYVTRGHHQNFRSAEPNAWWARNLAAYVRASCDGDELETGNMNCEAYSMIPAECQLR